MTSTVFTDNSTVIVASWLNDVNTSTYTTVPGLQTKTTNLPVVSAFAGTIMDDPDAASVRTTIGAAAIGSFAASGSNSDITSLNVTSSINGLSSINTGQLSGFRNAVINGSGLVQTRTAPTLTAALQYGVADRHLVGVTGATGVSGTVNILANTGFSNGIGYGAVAASWTTGAFIFKHRIEGASTKQYNSKTITVSGKLYQDTGGSRNFTISIGRPTTTLDTFSAVTNIGTSGAVSVATATVTNFSYTLPLGSTDANLGLEILITDTATNTITSKNYLVGDLQLEIGSVATTFEQRAYGLEALLCSRYYQIITGVNYGSNSGGGGFNMGQAVPFFPMRTTPTVGTNTGAANTNTGVTATVAASPSSVTIYAATTSNGQIQINYTYPLSAEL